MKELLFLAHRIPYPPNKGDKIRSWHLLRHLADHWRVHLGTFVDDPEDRQYVETVQKVCDQTCIRELNPTFSKLFSLTGLLSGQALTLPYYRDGEMQAWVDRILNERPIDAIVVYSGAMARFIRPIHHRGRRTLIDFVDVDSDKWRQYAESKTWPMSWVYRREARQLFKFERRQAGQFDAGVFVAAHEAQLFKEMAAESASRIDYYNNGVDVDYFSPQSELSNPYSVDAPHLVFTGAMDYWANIDAVCWFARDILPLIRREIADIHFCIVGGRPSAEVQALAELPGVSVTGRVEDVRPYIAHAAAAVIPLRIARGIQNKVLEAMAMQKPVISSKAAWDGIDAEPGRDLLVTDGEEQLARACIEVLNDKALADGLALAARQRILKQYQWADNLQRVDALLDPQQTMEQS